MEDLIVRLYPADEPVNGHANGVVTSLRNSRHFLAAPESRPLSPGRSSRESTAPPDANDENDAQGSIYGPSLQFSFSKRPKASPGFFLGTNPNQCDIILPRLRGISRRHCYLTCNKERQLILRDCSSNGTIVKYNGNGGEKRRNFSWVIASPKVTQHMPEIVLEFEKRLKFRIVVHRPLSIEVYFDRVDRFLQDMTASPQLGLGTLGIESSVSTVAASGTNTPSHEPIFLEQETIGKGAFSTVRCVWDVSTGRIYASKRFHNPSMSTWKAEASLMRQISHENLVRLHFTIERPYPQLILEYLPLGNLLQQHKKRRLTYGEAGIVLTQGLAALTYLHERVPPIMHRDIKPENILVRSRRPLHVQLGDFGLSKAGEELQTFCGTASYLAPEIARYYGSDGAAFSYTQAVDIWSLGVVVFEYAYGLPDPGSGSGPRWCYKIVKRLTTWTADNMASVLKQMVVIQPQDRPSARRCLEAALNLDFSKRSTRARSDDYQVRLTDDVPGSPTVRMSTRELLQKLPRAASKRQRSRDSERSGTDRRSTPTHRIPSALGICGIPNPAKGDEGDLVRPITYPSALDDVTNISGC